MDSLPDTIFLSLCSKPHPSGAHTEIKQTLRSDMQILLCDSCLILSSILERTAICYLESWQTQYGDSSTEVTELSFFFNFSKRKKENMLTCKWPANKISEKQKKQNWLDQSFRCFMFSEILWVFKSLIDLFFCLWKTENRVNLNVLSPI